LDTSTFATETEAIRLASDMECGLLAYVHTRDLNRSLRLAEELDLGMLGINTGSVFNPAAPFGGVKQSGLGRVGGFEGIDEYLEMRNVGVADPFVDT
jgi:succinate-semialdehyde dehydrogenase/glutarate-semialdehyde dehydrogenase